MKRTLQLLSIPIIVALLLVGLTPSLALDRSTRLEVMSGVVQISLVKIDKGEVYYLPWGSGTIISPDGLILTNCHVADPLAFGFSPMEVPDYDYLGIGLTVRSDQLPQLAYLGEAVQVDPYLDLAVVRITTKVDGTKVKPESLNLPYVERGDSGLLEVGDELNIFGYPGIGGDTVTFTGGVVSGFTLDAAITGRAWIKTDASISGGNSGGTAVDAQGLLVGVPTRAGDVDCRPVTDTNGDGMIDDRDSCVPIGGFINALRPVALAEPLIERARLGLPDVGKRDPGRESPGVTGTSRFLNLLFAPSVNALNQPTSVIRSLSSGSRSLYLFFDYENMSPSDTLEMRVWINGVETPDWGLPRGAWGGGAKGTWWVGWNDANFGDGVYRLVLYSNDLKMAEAEIEIGGRPTRAPTFSNIRLGLEATSSGDVREASVLFPTGTKTLYAAFDYANMSNTLQWTRAWLVDGQEALRRDENWSSGPAGIYSMELSSQQGLEPGAYRLNLYIAGDLVATSNFWVTGGEGIGASFGPILFAEGIDRQGNPLNAARSFPSGLPELYAFSEYSGMESGMELGVNWYLDGEVVISDPYDWDGDSEGLWNYYIYANDGALPDGQYDIELLVEGQVLQQGSTVIGTGARPTPVPSTSPRDGVQIQGTIADLDTGRPIPGAVFLVLMPGITLDTFQWTEAELYTSDEADRSGFYKLPDLLARGDCYTMIIGAEGYWMYGEDDVCIGSDTAALIDLPIRLEAQ